MTSPIPAAQIKQIIIYLNLLSYSPRGKENQLPSLQEYFGETWPQAVLEACKLIVAFQQASRDPENELIEELARAALSADSSPQARRAFVEKIDQLAQLPGRAKEQNRLHRKRGCRFCATPCRYGYFSLISEPNFDVLQRTLETENRKPSEQQYPIRTVWGFTLNHLSQALETGKWHIGADQLGNLSYCLVTLATTKSRYPFPEEKMRKFQDLNQQLIQEYVGSQSSER